MSMPLFSLHFLMKNTLHLYFLCPQTSKKSKGEHLGESSAVFSSITISNSGTQKAICVIGLVFIQGLFYVYKSRKLYECLTKRSKKEATLQHGKVG